MKEQFNSYLNQYVPWALTEFYQQPLWVWLLVPLTFAAAYLVSLAAVRISAMCLSWLIRRRYPNIFTHYVSPLLAPLELWICAVLFGAITHLLPLKTQQQAVLTQVVSTLATIAILWGLFRLLNSGVDALHTRLLSSGRSSAAAILPLLRKLLKAVLLVVALLFLLQNWGYDIAALLAGLGIGGIAIALAGQKSVENLFGGVSVTLDQPVRVGDFINYGDNVGTVEDIGLRSVTIRTLERTRVTIPNAQFSEMKLENFAARDKLLIKTIIGLRYETTPDQMRYIVMKFNELFVQHPKAENDGRARFVGFGSSSLDIELFAYLRTADWGEYLAIREDLFLRMMDIVHEAGSDFAFPSTTVYLERSFGLPAEQQEDIQRRMQELRADYGFHFPSVPAHIKEKMADTLPYPPDGSAAQN